MSEKLDTFADMTPIAPVDTYAESAPSQPNNARQPNVQQATDMNSQVENSGLDTFDNIEPIIPDNIKEQGEKNAKEQEQTQKSKGSEKAQVKRETDSLEMQEADDESDEGTDGEATESEGEDSSSTQEESDRQETTGTELEGKTIRLKVGDESIDINENATVPVKVKGRKEFVSLNELRENYSGKKAWGQELEKTKAKQAEIEQERTVWDRQREEVKEHFATIGEKLERAFSDPEADPLEAMNYLIELSGRNVLDYQKRMMEYFGNKAMEFYEMDEAQQQLYWTQKEIEILRNNQAAQARKVEERNATEQRQTQLAQVREKYGVSEEQFENALAELENEGFDLSSATPEQVTHYAALRDRAGQAEELARDLQEDLSTDEYESLISGTANAMLKLPEISALDALKLVARNMGLEIYSDEELIEQANQKVPQVQSRLDNRVNPKKFAQRTDDHIESFDDFENELYFNRR